MPSCGALEFYWESSLKCSTKGTEHYVWRNRNHTNVRCTRSSKCQRNETNVLRKDDTIFNVVLVLWTNEKSKKEKYSKHWNSSLIFTGDFLISYFWKQSSVRKWTVAPQKSHVLTTWPLAGVAILRSSENIGRNS